MDVTNLCAVCCRTVKGNKLGLFCIICKNWVHLRCTSLSRVNHHEISSTLNTWYCHLCLKDIFPFNHIEKNLEFLDSVLTSSKSKKPTSLRTMLYRKLNLINTLNALDGNIDPDKNFIQSHSKPIKYWDQNDLIGSQEYKNITNDNISVLHINARSLNNKIDDITQFIQNFTHKFTCIVVSETWIPAGSPKVKLPGYNVHMVSRKNRKGRELQFISQTLYVTLFVMSLLHFKIVM